MFVDLPYRADGTGRTATTESRHRRVRNLIEAVLFTAPGERVNRPDFGSGVYEMLFDANSQALETAADFLIRSAIQQHLAELVAIEQLTIGRDEGRLTITLTYTLAGDEDRRSETFVQGA